MSSSEPSIFSKIVSREIPANIVMENDRLIAFWDIAPKAPVHLLVVPKTQEYANVAELAAGDPQLLAELVGMAQELANEHANGEFRLVFNSGATAGQTVFHVHAHVLTGGLDEGSLGG
ncbi:MAG: histidine triad nucleotide-binding protein [Pontimonas sp.]|nr:histidine triad nucleotide-binding protein [Pontimonas sp.]MCF8547436.1 histidine triad nucleotide-binding protein [Pontimonas sp.]